MNQWIERIEQFLPNARVGKIQGEHIDIDNKDIVLGMLQSLSSKNTMILCGIHLDYVSLTNVTI